MKRFVSLWLTRWETDRFFRAHRNQEAANADAGVAFALVERGPGGARLCALTSAAIAQGLAEGMLLTDACALLPSLQTAPRAPDAAREDLKALARWCERFTPCLALDQPDGMLLDITGCAHLFGGEDAMLAEIAARLQGFHLQARIACADTPGAAWAMARHGQDRLAVIAPGRQAEALAALPVKALRIEPGVAALLDRLGLDCIGRLAGMPRAPLAARFGAELLRRLDQAMGRAEEALAPLTPVRRFAARTVFPEPVTELNAIEAVARALAEKLCLHLQGAGRGATSFTLNLFGADGSLRLLTVSSARLLYRAEDVSRLFHERIHAIEAVYDPGAGVDAMSLEASSVEAVKARQPDLSADGPNGEALSFLLDRLAARLGNGAIGTLEPAESHIPERAQRRARLGGARLEQSWRAAPRPLLLLPRPEPVEVVAEIPDGPPAHFTWRRVRRRVAFADGPERIAPEWWREEAAPTRDYFRVEDSEHRRYWLYRDGLYGSETGAPRWFLHGVFA